MLSDAYCSVGIPQQMKCSLGMASAAPRGFNGLRCTFIAML